MRFHHFAIEVSDLETSATFYQKYFGLKEERLKEKLTNKTSAFRYFLLAYKIKLRL